PSPVQRERGEQKRQETQKGPLLGGLSLFSFLLCTPLPLRGGGAGGGGYGRSSVTTGEVQVSQCAGLFASPSAFKALTTITYEPSGTTLVFPWLPLLWIRVPSQAKEKKLVAVLLRGRKSSSSKLWKTGWTGWPVAAFRI